MESARVIHVTAMAGRLGQRRAGRSTLKLARTCLGQTQQNHAKFNAPFHAVSVYCILCRDVEPT